MRKKEQMQTKCQEHMGDGIHLNISNSSESFLFYSFQWDLRISSDVEIIQ